METSSQSKPLPYSNYEGSTVKEIIGTLNRYLDTGREEFLWDSFILVNILQDLRHMRWGEGEEMEGDEDDDDIGVQIY